MATGRRLENQTAGVLEVKVYFEAFCGRTLDDDNDLGLATGERLALIQMSIVVEGGSDMVSLLNMSAWAVVECCIEVLGGAVRLMHEDGSTSKQAAATPRETFHETSPFLHGKGGYVDK